MTCKKKGFSFYDFSNFTNLFVAFYDFIIFLGLYKILEFKLILDIKFLKFKHKVQLILILSIG